ncbi:MAG: polysaccharide biosynthesis protein [Ruminococcaceae bacterium]|nr:polysaccharide biosynthesis protein [Oscillospiraceae bacterium]
MEKVEKKQTMLNGALILMIATAVGSIIGALYKLPLTALIGEVGRGYFASAYQIYVPIYAISMAGLPVAVSKLVSEYMASNRYRDALNVKAIAGRMFLITGIAGTLLLMILAYPYAAGICEKPQTVWSILAIAPSIFFCCLMSTYRGYYEGSRNMVPTAVTEIIENIARLVIGLALSYIVMDRGMAAFNETGKVFGKALETESEALSALYPIAAAAAIMGVTIGTILAFLYMHIRFRIRGTGITRVQLVNSEPAQAKSKTAKKLISLAIPMVISSLVLNVSNLIDASLIQKCLAIALEKDYDMIYNMYKSSLEASGTLAEDTKNYLVGCYFSSQDLRNIIPSITMSLGVSAIPALSAAYAVKDKKTQKTTIESVLRIASLIALPAGLGMGVLSEPILTLFYGGTDAQNLIPIAAPIMAVTNFFTFFFAISSPITNMLQSIGRADIPVKSLVVGSVAKIVADIILIPNPKYNIKGAMVGTILCYVIIVVINLVMLLRISKVKINFVSVFFKPLACASLSAGVGYMAYVGLEHLFPASDYTQRFNGSTISCIISVVIIMIVYLISMLLIRGLSSDDIKMLPKGEKIAKMLEKYKLLG